MEPHDQTLSVYEDKLFQFTNLLRPQETVQHMNFRLGIQIKVHTYK
jgi:hypothetical protein